MLTPWWKLWRLGGFSGTPDPPHPCPLPADNEVRWLTGYEGQDPVDVFRESGWANE